jgi:hypothetical protein
VRVVVERHGPVVALAVDEEVDLSSTVEVEVELALVQATLDSARLTAVRDALVLQRYFVIFACLRARERMRPQRRGRPVRRGCLLTCRVGDRCV